MKIEEKYEIVSPAMARLWIKEHLDPLQRPLKKQNLEKIRASYAEHGFCKWMTLVVFSDEGTLIEGRHSLHVLSEGTATRELFVVRGVPRTMIAALGGDASTVWRRHERLALATGEKLSKDDLAVVNWLASILDEEPRMRTDSQQAEEASRFSMVVINSRLLPDEAVGGLSLRCAGIRAAMAIGATIDGESFGKFLNEIIGAAPATVASNELLATVRSWKSRAPSAEMRRQSLRLLKCIEIGMGLSPAQKRITSDEGCPIRWKDRYDQWLSRRPILRASGGGR